MSSVVAAFSLLILSVLVGISISSKITNKKNFYKALLDFNNDLLTEIKFQRNDVNFLLLKSYMCDDFNELLKQKLHIINGLYSEIYFPKYVDKNEEYELKEYFSKMGMQDADTSIELLTRYGEVFFKKYTDLMQEDKIKGTLYRKMGVMVGIIAFIIVI